MDGPEPLIYMAWASQLQKALLADIVGASSLAANTFRFYDAALIVRLLDHEAATGGAAKAQAMLQATLDQAVATLAKAYGADIDGWRWGDAHRATLTSQLFGKIPVLGSLFDAGLPAPGGPETVNRGGIFHTDGVRFEDAHGPGYRGVFDLADLDASRFIIATGESGNPFSPHYGDMARRWRDGDAITLSGSEAELAKTGDGTQHFLP